MWCCPAASRNQSPVCQHGGLCSQCATDIALLLDLAKKSSFWMKKDHAAHFSTQAGNLVLVDGAAAGQALGEGG